MQLDGWCCTLGRKTLPREAAQRDAESQQQAQHSIGCTVWLMQLRHTVTHSSADAAHQQSDQDVRGLNHGRVICSAHAAQ